MEIRAVRREEAAGLRELRLRALRDAPHWLWVAPGARGRGLARRLLEARADWARELGAVRLELAMAEHNEPAKALYRGLGFVPTGERRSMASDPTRAGIFMARPL